VTAETACYIYGIVAAGTPVPDDLVGIGDTAVKYLEHGAVAAVVGTVTVDRPLGRRADLLAYSNVLDGIAATGAIVPVRFGTVLPTREDVVAELLGPHEEHFVAVLGELEGRQQFNLRARYDEETVLGEVVGENADIAELRERTRDVPEDASYAERVRLGELVARALDGKRADDGDTILEEILPHTVAYNVREGGGLDHLLDVAFLVDADRREDFEAAAEKAGAAMGDRARLRLLGPLAPYDFVPEG
jgi:Gas vesicle synthesis protein GvpL/GvpF